MVSKFRDDPAMVADRKAGKLAVMGPVAGDKRVQRFDPVRQTITHQPLQGPVNRWRGIHALFAQHAEKIVGGERLRSAAEKLEDTRLR